MIEDKLTQTQRMRLEALSQAVAASGPQAHLDYVTRRADAFVSFIKNGTVVEADHNEDTMFKIQEALRTIQYSDNSINNIINAILNAGVVFREFPG